MRLPKITLAISAIFLLPVSVFSQFGLENQAHLEADYFYQKATAHHDASEFTSAIDAYQRALDFEPERTDAWYNLALVLMHTGDFQRAERSLDTLFTYSPFDAQAHALHGTALYRQKEYGRAISAFNFALQEKPSKDLFLARGLAHFHTGQLHLASLDFDEVLAKDPGHVRACQAKASLLFEKGNYHLAIRFCNRILDQMPSDVKALTVRALCRFRQGASYRAMADFDLAMTSGQMADTYLARAICRMEEGNFHGALNDARIAMRIDPFEAEVYSLLAMLEFAEGETGEALESMAIALEMEPENARYHFQLAQFSLEIADFETAISEVYSALNFGLENKRGKAFLLKVYQRMDEERHKNTGVFH